MFVCVCLCVPALHVCVNEFVNSEAGKNKVKVYVEVVHMDVSSHQIWLSGTQMALTDSLFPRLES